MLAETVDAVVPMDAVARVASRYIHFAAFITAVGGMIFLRLVLLPAARGSLTDDTFQTLRAAVLSRWTRIMQVSILLLILTGSYNAYLTIPQHLKQPLYHSLFGLKVLLALGLFFIASALTGKSPTFEPMRRKAAFWLTINILLAAVIVLFSNVLKNLPASTGG